LKGSAKKVAHLLDEKFEAARTTSIRENEALGVLTKYGRRVTQGEFPAGTRFRTDAMIEDFTGRVQTGDVYSPKTADLRGIARTVATKGSEGKAVIVVDLDRTGASASQYTVSQVAGELGRYVLDGVREVLVVRGGEAYSVYRR
jgi:hypothetical protein